METRLLNLHKIIVDESTVRALIPNSLNYKGLSQLKQYVYRSAYTQEDLFNLSFSRLCYIFLNHYWSQWFHNTQYCSTLSLWRCFGERWTSHGSTVRFCHSFYQCKTTLVGQQKGFRFKNCAKSKVLQSHEESREVEFQSMHTQRRCQRLL